MQFLVTLLLDANKLEFTLPRRLDLVDFEVGVIRFAIPKTLKNPPSYLNLTSDLLTPQPGTLYPTLITVPYDEKCYYEPNVTYCPMLANNYFASISMSILDENGKKVSFDSGLALIVLHFRPIKCNMFSY